MPAGIVHGNPGPPPPSPTESVNDVRPQVRIGIPPARADPPPASSHTSYVPVGRSGTETLVPVHCTRARETFVVGFLNSTFIGPDPRSALTARSPEAPPARDRTKIPVAGVFGNMKSRTVHARDIVPATPPARVSHAGEFPPLSPRRIENDAR